VFYPILEYAPAGSAGVAPGVICNELLKGAVTQHLRTPFDAYLQAINLPPPPPRIEHASHAPRMTLLILDLMRHRSPNVVLAVKCPRDPSDCRSRDDLLNEDNGSSPFALCLTPDVKPQVDFFEVSMEGHRHSHDSGSEEKKPDERD
jgi:hypothetical protein